MTLATKVGVSVGDPDHPAHVAVVREPTTGETVRTKGSLYVLIDVRGRDAAARDAAREAAETLRDEYYYDQSAGIDVSLRRAILQANKRARTRLRPADSLHLACAVLRRNELYAARVGAAEVFVIRRARLFIPGSTAGELTDYAFRGAVGVPPPLGADSELLVSVWREQAEPGDTIVLAGDRVVDAVGADALKNAALTLHPTAAAEHVQELYVREAGRAGDAAVLIVEVSAATGAPRLAGRAAKVADPEVEAIAERIRTDIDHWWDRRPRVGGLLRSVTRAVARPVAAVVAIGLALTPRSRTPLPRHAETAAVRAARRRRVSGVLAILFLLASAGLLALANANYQDAQRRGAASQLLIRADSEIGNARAAAQRTPPDVSGARIRLERATGLIGEAVATKFADPGRVADLRGQIDTLERQLTTVVLDLAKADAKSAPASLDFTTAGMFIADKGAGKVWRAGLDGNVGAVAQTGLDELSAPTLLTTQGDVVYVMDDKGRLFRYEGAAHREIVLREHSYKEPVDIAIFANNIYVLDRAAGQVWKYEPSPDGAYNAPPIAFLAQALPAGTARSLSVDGDLWIVTDDGRLSRYSRRSSGGSTAQKVDFSPQWSGDAPAAVAAQARDSQRSIYLLDARARRVVQVTKDGRELARIALPEELPDATAFIVDEASGFVISVHGTKLARTDFGR